MAAKYHISDNGMPGKCSAASPDSCPKTQAGDSFHGTLEEASAESAKRFEDKLGAFVTSSKADQKKAEVADAFAQRFDANVKGLIADPSNAELLAEQEALRAHVEAESRAGRGSAIINNPTYENAVVALSESQNLEIYVHPQGKIIKVDADGNVRAYKDGKEVSTSATAAKLRGGYGSWKRNPSAAAKLPAAAATPAALTPEQQDALVDEYDGKVAAVKEAREAALALFREQQDYDSKNAGIEGRFYHIGTREDGSIGQIDGPHPDSPRNNLIRKTEEQIAARDAANEAVRNARDAEEKAQTELEESGLGHRIPDEGNTIRVRTQAQKWLLKDELQGQISDGKWENTSNNPWQDWSGAKVVVDPKNPGRNFHTRKDNYQLNASDLLEVVGDRMVGNVRTKTATPGYDDKAMGRDLSDLRKIFKTHRDQVSGD